MRSYIKNIFMFGLDFCSQALPSLHAKTNPTNTK